MVFLAARRIAHVQINKIQCKAVQRKYTFLCGIPMNKSDTVKDVEWNRVKKFITKFKLKKKKRKKRANFKDDIQHFSHSIIKGVSKLSLIKPWWHDFNH